MGVIGGSLDRDASATDALCRAVAALSALRALAIELHQHGVIDAGPKGFVHGPEIGGVAIGGELNLVSKPAREIVHEHAGAI